MLLCCLCIALLAPPPAQLDQAKTLYEAGSAAYQAGKYAVAIDAFEATRAISERPVVIFSLAQAYRLRFFQDNKLSDLEAAVANYRRYLELAPDGPRKAHTTQHLSTLVPYLERLRIEGDQGPEAPRPARLIVTSSVLGAEARVDDGPEQPVPSTFEVAPGTHTVQIAAAGYQTATRQTVAVAGSTLALAIEPTPEPALLRLSATAGARIVVDRQEVGRAPLATPLALAPGDHHLIVRGRGYTPHQQRLTLAPAQEARLDVELETTTQRWVAWSLMGGAALLAGAAAWTGSEALSAESDAQDLERRLGSGISDAEFERYTELRDDRDAYRDATTFLVVGAGAALVSGVLLYIFDDPTPAPALQITPEGGAATWRW